MPEAFQPVDHLVVSRAGSPAKESLKTVRQLPGMPSGLVDAGVLGAVVGVELGVVGAVGVAVALGAVGVLGVLGVLGGGAVGVAADELEAEAGTDVDGETGAGRW